MTNETIYLEISDNAELSLPNEVTNVRILMNANQVIRLDKTYGPWAVWDIRCRLDYDSGDWVIEQSYCETDENGNDGDLLWIERARFCAWSPEVKDPEERFNET